MAYRRALEMGLWPIARASLTFFERCRKMRFGARFLQGWNRVWAWLRFIGAGDLPAQQILSPEAYRLFRTMGWGDRAHGLYVLDLLKREEGAVPPEVAAAALLHDVGKAKSGLTLAHRALVVILRALAPHSLERLGAPGGPRWQRPFYIQRCHAEIGAQRCARAGCDPLTVALVRWHDAPAPRGVLEDELLSRWLSALQRADARC